LLSLTSCHPYLDKYVYCRKNLSNSICSVPVQRECIPHAVLGLDVLCQATDGTGKTALFVLATLHQLEMDAREVTVIVLCSCRKRAKIIYEEYLRLSKYMTTIKV
jgi:ATP-dependent RNA helicase UAP56/SUB2